MSKFSTLSATAALGAALITSAHFADAAAGADKAYGAAMDKMMKDINKPATGKPDFDFVTGMIPHHQGAVAMAKVEKQFGKYPDMLKLADAVIASQTSEIALMKGWLKTKPLSGQKILVDAKSASKMAMDKMMGDMMTSKTGKADIDFARGMIPHHQGAIDMAKVDLKFGTDGDVKKLATDVVSAQESEIAVMQQWLTVHAK